MKQKLIEALQQADLLNGESVSDCSSGLGGKRKTVLRVNGLKGTLAQRYFPIIVEFCKKYDLRFYVDAMGDIPSIRIYGDM